MNRIREKLRRAWHHAKNDPAIREIAALAITTVIALITGVRRR